MRSDGELCLNFPFDNAVVYVVCGACDVRAENFTA